MSERKWDNSIDGQIEDEPLPRIDNVDWGDAREYGLDVDLVGLAIGTNHTDAKIALSGQLIDIHNQHVEFKKKNAPSNNRNLLPENIIDRLVYGMISACNKETGIPNILLRLLSLRMEVSPHPQKGVQDPSAYRDLLHVVADNPTISRNTAAKAAGISPSAARTWMNDPEFKRFAEIIRRHGVKPVI